MDANGGFGPVGQLPGPYESLYWTIINVPGYCGRTCAIYANTFPVYAYFNETVPASASAAYSGSKVLGFDLFNFAYGCAAPRAIKAGSKTYNVDEPVNCQLEVEGYRTPTASGPPAMTTNITFRPQTFTTNYDAGLPQAYMQVYNVTNFRGLRYMRFVPKLTNDNGDLSGPLKAYIDTINYRTYNFTA